MIFSRSAFSLCAVIAIGVYSGSTAGAQGAPVISTVNSGTHEQASRPKRETISVVMDQALVVRSPDRVRTMILGNPSIADISSEGKGMLVITGKAYGSTNLVLIDEDGKVVGESLIQVGPARAGVVTVQKGDIKQAYSCTPKCMPMAQVGTTPSFFSEASSQAQQRYGQQGGGGGGAPAAPSAPPARR